MLIQLLHRTKWLVFASVSTLALVALAFFGHQMKLFSNTHSHTNTGSHQTINCESICGSKPVETQTVKESDEIKEDDFDLLTMVRNTAVITFYGIILFQLTRWFGTRKIPIYKQMECYRI
jgi:hypothetical protein